MNDGNWSTGFLVVLGLLTFVKFTLKAFYVLVQTFVLRGKSLNQFGAKKGSWAVVTGASDGIGREFAFQLASAGFNIILVARNHDALSATAAQINTQSGSKVSTLILVIDFSKDSHESYEKFACACEGLDIGVLVNNVGRSHAMPTDFVDCPKDEIEDIVTINIKGTLRVTQTILPGMIMRKRGLVINIGSFAGSVPSPMLATYSGTKAFLTAFTTALAEEVKEHNIVVENLNTYFVVSKLSKIRKSSILIPTPTTYVRSTLCKIGLPCGAAFSGRPDTSTPYWSHSLLDYSMTTIGWKGLFVKKSHGRLMALRRRALKKMEKERKNE